MPPVDDVRAVVDDDKDEIGARAGALLDLSKGGGDGIGREDAFLSSLCRS